MLHEIEALNNMNYASPCTSLRKWAKGASAACAWRTLSWRIWSASSERSSAPTPVTPVISLGAAWSWWVASATLPPVGWLPTLRSWPGSLGDCPPAAVWAEQPSLSDSVQETWAKARCVPSNSQAWVEQAGLCWRVAHWQNGHSAWA